MDHVSDKNGVLLHQIGTQFVMPSFVKTASLLEKEDIKELEPNVFADPINRQYPIHTKADTWLSTACFYKSASEYPASKRNRISDRLVAACKWWNLNQNDFKHVLQKEAADTGVKLRYEMDGEVVHETSVHSKEDFQKVASDLHAHRDLYPYEMRKGVARQLLKMPAEFAEGISDDMLVQLEKTASMQCVQKTVLEKALQNRKALYRAAGKPELADTVDGILKEASAIAVNDCLFDDLFDKIASRLDDCDRLANLHKHYSAGVTPPEFMGGGIARRNAARIVGGVVALPNGSFILKSAVDKNKTDIESVLQRLVGDVEEQSLMQALEGLTSKEASLLCRELGDIIAELD